jgi:hypothetical protein
MSDIISQNFLQHTLNFDELGLKASSDERPLPRINTIPASEVIPRKRCSHCKQVYSVALFGKNASGKDGLHNMCKQCAKEYSREMRELLKAVPPKTCSECNETKPASDFYAPNALYCKQCRRKWNTKGKMSARNASLKQRFNITQEDYESMLFSQGGVCAICGEPPKEGSHLHVDHCHKTGVVRALLCRGCNVAIGSMRENPDIMRRAALYVEKHNSALPPEEP